jgi:hypothetical protein
MTLFHRAGSVVYRLGRSGAFYFHRSSCWAPTAGHTNSFSDQRFAGGPLLKDLEDVVCRRAFQHVAVVGVPLGAVLGSNAGLPVGGVLRFCPRPRRPDVVLMILRCLTSYWHRCVCALLIVETTARRQASPQAAGDGHTAGGLPRQIFKDVLIWESLRRPLWACAFAPRRCDCDRGRDVHWFRQWSVNRINSQQVMNVRDAVAPPILAAGLWATRSTSCFLMAERRIQWIDAD